MTKASDNPFPSLLIVEGTEPSAPAAGRQRLYIDSTTHKLKRTDSSGTDVTIESTETLPATIIDAKGDLIVGSAADTAARLAVGTDGHVLTADSASTNGVKWAASGASTLTTKGDLLTYDTGAARLAVGTDGQVLTADSAQAKGVKWATPTAGGLTRAYVGYNTVGGSSEAIVDNRQYMKKITLANDCVLGSISAYIKQVTAGWSMGMSASILTDSAGDPALEIARSHHSGNDNNFLSTSNGSAGAARWFHAPMGVELAAGDYWIAVQFRVNNGSSYNIYYDGSGSDRYFTNGANDRMSDSGWTTVTTSSNKYSIRANTMR